MEDENSLVLLAGCKIKTTGKFIIEPYIGADNPLNEQHMILMKPVAAFIMLRRQ